MTTDEKALVITSALLFAVRLRNAEGFRRWLNAGLDELLPALTDEDCDRIVGCLLGESW